MAAPGLRDSRRYVCFDGGRRKEGADDVAATLLEAACEPHLRLDRLLGGGRVGDPLDRVANPRFLVDHVDQGEQHPLL